MNPYTRRLQILQRTKSTYLHESESDIPEVTVSVGSSWTQEIVCTLWCKLQTNIRSRAKAWLLGMVALSELECEASDSTKAPSKYTVWATRDRSEMWSYLGRVRDCKLYMLIVVILKPIGRTSAPMFTSLKIRAMLQFLQPNADSWNPGLDHNCQIGSARTRVHQGASIIAQSICLP